MATETTSPRPSGSAGRPRRSFTFPSAFTVLFVVTVAVWVLAFVVPTGAYRVSARTGGPVPGSYHHVDAGLSFTDRLMQLFLSPVNGLYGVRGSNGFISPYESGELFGAAGVFFFVLAIGIFITMSMQTGAIDVGVGRVAHRFSARGALLITMLMVLFSIGGTTEGMAEETLGFYALVVPLMLSLGYDRMVAAATILIGAGVGVLASTVNPFATGVASGAAGISIGDGIGLRFLMYVVLVPVAILFVLRYARRVKADPSRSMVGLSADDQLAAARGAGDGTGFAQKNPDLVGELPAMTGKQKAVIAVVAFTFAFMIFAIVPWAQVIHGPDAASFGWQLDWYFPELAALFLLMSLVVGLIGGFGEKRLTDTLVKGAGDFVGVGLIIVLARGITVIMNNGQITDTVLHSMESAVSGTSAAVFGSLMFFVNIPLAFLVPSTSGHATIAMPILAPLADFAGVPRAIVITAFQSASGIVNLITPTSAVVMGGLALAKVRYDQYLKFIAPLLLVLFVLCTAFIAIGAALS